MDAIATTDFIHVFEPGKDSARPPLLLLHGTGGDERDLLGLAPWSRPA
jgi:phospholipase/carboxylesterase